MEIQLWKELLQPYEQAVTELTAKFNCLRDEYRKNNQHSPIETVSGRVKTVTSILEKMQKKGIVFDRLEEEIEDIAGIRIICQFVEDIEKVAVLIRRRYDMVVIEKKDYLANHKSSGYRSYHMIVWYTVETINGPKQIHVEIQIRTMAMNFWATTEHSLQYKYKGVLPPHVSKQLEVIADSVYQLDTQMSRVRSEIIDAENHSETRTNLIKDIVTSIENLYKITNHREVEKIQDEFYRIFKMNDIDELKRFQRHLDVLAEGFRAQSVEYEAPDPRKGG